MSVVFWRLGLLFGFPKRFPLDFFRIFTSSSTFLDFCFFFWGFLDFPFFAATLLSVLPSSKGHETNARIKCEASTPRRTLLRWDQRKCDCRAHKRFELLFWLEPVSMALVGFFSFRIKGQNKEVPLKKDRSTCGMRQGIFMAFQAQS